MRIYKPRVYLTITKDKDGRTVIYGAQTTPTLPQWEGADFGHCFWKDKYFSRFMKAEGGKNETNV